jgi:hypothetical protein
MPLASGSMKTPLHSSVRTRSCKSWGREASPSSIPLDSSTPAIHPDRRHAPVNMIGLHLDILVEGDAYDMSAHLASIGR